MTAGLYVYGLTARGSLGRTPRATGITGDPPLFLDAEQLTAIVSGVDVSEFEGEALERNAASAGWLERKVRAHEAVLEDLLVDTTIIPMRFGSIFSSADGLRRMLDANAASLRHALERVDGRTEWGVKVHCDPGQLVASLAGASPEPGSGRGYLMQKKAEMDAAREAEGIAARAAAEVHESLGEIADEAVVADTRTGEVLNGAYLVHHGARDEFMQRVEELQRDRQGAFTFEVTGPWPPYNFASADVGGPRS